MDAVTQPGDLRANIRQLPPEKRRQVEQLIKQLEKKQQDQPAIKRNRAC